MSEETMSPEAEQEAMQAQMQEEVVSDADALLAESMGMEQASPLTPMGRGRKRAQYSISSTIGPLAPLGRGLG